MSRSKRNGSNVGNRKGKGYMRDRRSNERKEPTKDSREKRVNYDNAREDKVMKDISCTNQSNDVSWYANNPELLRSAASLPFSTTTGIDLPYYGNQDVVGANKLSHNVPGILTAYWEPSIGGKFDDPINRAKDSTYSFTVHANSRNKSYDGADEMNLILAGANLFSAIGMGVRAYGIMRNFDQQNKYWPEGFIQAMGFSYPDLRDNYSRMWFDLNEIIARSRQVWIPNVFPFIQRWFWMSTNIYMDSQSTKGQYYMYVPNGFWMYDEDLQGNGIGGLRREQWAKTVVSPKGGTTKIQNFVGGIGTDEPIVSGTAYPGHTWKDYMAILNEMIESLVQSQDRGIIFGDILKAYGEGNIYALQPLSVDYVTPFVYDPEVLSQFENSNAYPGYAWGVAQNPVNGHMYAVGDGYTSTTVNTKPTNILGLPWKILNFHQKEIPSPEQIMVATRMCCLGAAGVGKNDQILTFNAQIPETSGTEYVHHYGITIFLSSAVTQEVDNLEFDSASNTWKTTSTATLTYSSGTPVVIPTTFMWTGSIEGGMNTPFMGVNDCWNTCSMLWAAFDWAPWGVLAQNNNTITSSSKQADIKPGVVARFIGDFDMYTTIDISELKKMHATAIYSEFNVPSM